MFGWRKRNHGFEWREYVRTTILLRRRNRRERVERAAHAAVDGLKVAGQRGAAAGAAGAEVVGRGAKVAGHRGAAMGVAGAQALGRGAKVAAHRGVALSAVGLRAAGAGLRAGLPKVWAALEVFGRGIAKALAVVWAGLCGVTLRLAELLAPVAATGWRGLQPMLCKLRRPGIAIVLALIAGVAFVGSFRRIAANGFDGSIFIALLIGTLIACALLAAWLADGPPAWLAALLRGTGRGAAGLAGAVGSIGPSGATLARGAAVLALLAVVAGAGWLVWRAAAALPSLASFTQGAPAIEGRAIALSGDTLRIAKKTVRISGIEAPEREQTCRTASARRWRCGASAKSALARLVRRRNVTCVVSGSDDRGIALGNCRIGKTDIAAELVRNGHVFATPGFFAPYGSLEEEARKAKSGLWEGEATRPSDYRAQRWEEAKREAPEGCPIKGNVSRGRRVYVLPWSSEYERVRISSRRGERWFCSEAEALAAGWQPSDQS